MHKRKSIIEMIELISSILDKLQAVLCFNNQHCNNIELDIMRGASMQNLFFCKLLIRSISDVCIAIGIILDLYYSANLYE